MGHPIPRINGEGLDDDPVAAAIRRYEERLARDPSSMAFAPLAEIHRKAGRTGDAIRLCREGLARVPDYHTARLILAKALVDEGDPDAGLAEVMLILASSPREAPAHRLAAEVHRRAGRLDEAAAHLREVVTLDATDRESRVMLDVLDGAGAVPEGSALRRVLGDDTFATLSFGGACLEQGLVDEAAQVFVRVLRKDPGNARARERLDEALRVKIQRRKGS